MAPSDRPVLSDAQWARMAPLAAGRPGTRGAKGHDDRLFVEAVPWIVCTGAPWRDPPEGDPRCRRMVQAAEAHLAASLPSVAGDDMGERWLATYAALALRAP